MTKVKNNTKKLVAFSYIKEGKADPDQRTVWFTVPVGVTVDIPSEVVWRATVHGLTTLVTESPIPQKPTPPKQTTSPTPQKVIVTHSPVKHVVKVKVKK